MKLNNTMGEESKNNGYNTIVYAALNDGTTPLCRVVDALRGGADDDGALANIGPERERDEVWQSRAGCEAW